MKYNDARADKVELRWRHDLLSSSLQLEYRVARRVVSHGYSARADYTYARVANGVEKEYSVDLLGQASLVDAESQVDENTPPDEIADVKLLAECKYRKPGVSWLFVPEIESAAVSRAETIRSVAAFSDWVGVKPSRELVLPSCYKGVEIDLASHDKNRVTDQELRHGLEQLQYALIPMLKDVVQNSAVSLAEEFGSAPVFILPVLVTTAPLYVAVGNFDEVDLSSVTALEEFARRVPALTIDMVIGTQLVAEVRRHFSTGLDESITEMFDALDAKRKAQKKKYPGVASMVYRSLKNTNPSRLRRWLSRFVICNIDYLDTLISEVDDIVNVRTSKLTRLQDVSSV